MNCWICREHTEKNNLCDCENDYSYVHNHCIEKFVYPFLQVLSFR